MGFPIINHAAIFLGSPMTSETTQFLGFWDPFCTERRCQLDGDETAVDEPDDLKAGSRNFWERSVTGSDAGGSSIRSSILPEIFVILDE